MDKVIVNELNTCAEKSLTWFEIILEARRYTEEAEETFLPGVKMCRENTNFIIGSIVPFLLEIVNRISSANKASIPGDSSWEFACKDYDKSLNFLREALTTARCERDKAN